MPENNEINKDNDIDVMEIKVWNVNFNVPLTYDEANALVNDRKGKVAKELKRYILKVFKRGAEKVLDAMIKNKTEVKKCKVEKQ